MTRPFLTARWESLLFLDFACPREALEPLVPAGTELDAFEGVTIVSLVGLLFVDTRVRGVAIPCHHTFEEVNLRFYVRREGHDASPARRGVVFVRELVPRAAVAAVARAAFGEPYRVAPMRRRIALDAARGGSVEYAWRFRGHDHRIAGEARGAAVVPAAGSEAEFVVEHRYGYSRSRDGSTFEYEVEHPPWRVFDDVTATFEGPPEPLYGPALAPALSRPPRSARIAVGSEVLVFPGRKLGQTQF